MSDGLNFAPRVREPESALIPGMAAGAPQKAVERFSSVGALGMPDTSISGPVSLQEPIGWVYDFDPATGSARATFTGEVSFTSGGSGSAGVTTWNGRTGAVTLTSADVTGAGGATANNASLTGVPTVPTAAPGTSTTQIASTAYVQQAISANPIVQSFNGRTGAVTLTAGDVTGAGGAPAVSPALTGVPTAPTATQGTASGQIATTQFVSNAIAGGAVTSWNGRQGAVTLTLSDVLSVGGAPIASPSFTGVPSGPTAAPGTSTTQLASTAFVTNAVVAASSGVATFNGRSGAVTLTTADVTGAGGAPILSPNITGTPTAPTPTAGDSSTKLATTAFVAAAITASAGGVASFNGRTGAVTLQLADVTSVGGAPLASPAMTGTPTVPTATPATNTTQAASTAFVTAAIAALPAGPTASSTVPNMDGTAAIGAITTSYALPDHVHPTDTSRAAQSSLANYLPLAGGTLTGPLTGTTVAGTTSNFRNVQSTVAGSNIVVLHGGTVGTISGTVGFSYDAVYGGIFEASSAIPVSLNRIGSNGTIVAFYQSGTSCGSISVANANATAYNTTSDGRLKTDKREFDAGPVIDSLKPWNFRWLASGSRAHGLIAQDTMHVYPEAVTHDPASDAWGIDYSKFVPLLIAEIKALRLRVAALEAAATA